MKQGTLEVNHRHAQTGEELPKRWWIWKGGRRRYFTIEPVVDKEAGARRTKREIFQKSYRASLKPKKKPPTSTWSSHIRVLVKHRLLKRQQQTL